jgi:hypothetical protein
MSRHVVVSSAAMVIAWASMLMAQRDVALEPRDPPPDAAAVQELTLVGCVVESAEAGVYILDNAVARPEIEHVPRTFRLVSAGEKLDFTLHTNHQVQTTGLAEMQTPPPPPPGVEVDARDLPALNVKVIQSVSERCLT